MDLNNFLIVSAILFSIGLYGALTKKHLVVIFMCIELMFNAVNLALVGFSKYQNLTLVNLNGHIFYLGQMLQDCRILCLKISSRIS